MIIFRLLFFFIFFSVWTTTTMGDGKDGRYGTDDGGQQNGTDAGVDGRT